MRQRKSENNTIRTNRISMNMARIVLCMVLTVLFVCVQGKRIRAAEPVCAESVTMYYTTYSGDSQIHGMDTIHIANLSEDALISNMKSSNKKVEVFEGNKGITISVKEKKGGKVYTTYSLKNGEKTTVTFDVEDQGKTYSFSVQVTFRKEINPLKAIKIGKKTFKSMKLKKGFYTINTGMKLPSKVKISLKAKSGYTIVKIYADYYKKGWAKSETKAIKNGSTIKTSYKGATLDGLAVYFYSELPENSSGVKLGLGDYRLASYALKFK